MLDEIHQTAQDKQDEARKISERDLLREGMQRLMQGVAQQACNTFSDEEISDSKYYKHSKNKDVLAVREELMKAWTQRLSDKIWWMLI